MLATDRITGYLRQEDTTLRGVSVLFGINLILAGMIIFLFPEVLVFIIALGFVVSGIGVIATAMRRLRRGTKQYTIRE